MSDNQWASVVNNNKQALESARLATENAQANFDQASRTLNVAEIELSAARSNNNTAAISTASNKVLDASIAKSDALQKLIQAQNNELYASNALNLAQQSSSRVSQVEQVAPAVSYPIPNPASNSPNIEPTASVPPPEGIVGSRLPNTDSTTFAQQTNNQILRAIGAPNAAEAFNQQTNANIVNSITTQQNIGAGISNQDGGASAAAAAANQATNASVLRAIGAPSAGEAYVAQTNANIVNSITTQQNIGASTSNQDGGASAAAANQATNTSILNAIGAPSAGEAYVAQTNANVLGAIGANVQGQGGSTAASVNAARSSGAIDTFRQTRQKEDWRVRLSLAPSASNYLYNVAKQGDLLYPLKGTDGVIFPYNPTISLNYKANYEITDIVHTNYKQYFYKNSSVEEVSIQADFTCQDVSEANYVLAMIHFFRSVTKMFYGQDGKNGGPPPGTPPPLCYLFGYGQYQFSDHPVLITSFNYTLPNDVDYIRAGSTQAYSGVNVAFTRPKVNQESSKLGFLNSLLRLQSSNLQPGGISAEPTWVSLANSKATYIPTKLQITVTCIPIVTRRDISENFSVEYYATGELYKSGVW